MTNTGIALAWWATGQQVNYAATVSFPAVDSEIRVRHTIFSEATTGSAIGADNTVHEVAILPPPAATSANETRAGARPARRA